MPVIRAGAGADFAFEVGELDASALRVLRFHGTEGLSELFGFELELLSSADEVVSFDDVVGQPAHLSLVTSEGERWIHGIVCRFEQTGRSRKLSHYAARLVPKLWTLTLIRECQIFQNLTTPEILKQVLEGAGIPADQFKLSLKASYPPRKYCVQYRETDFDFIARLMEEEGIWYCFAHDEEQCVLTMGDDPSTPEAIAGEAEVTFREGEGGLLGTAEQVVGFRYGRSMRTGAVVLKEYDFKKPKQKMKVAVEAEADAHLVSYDYPGEYPDETVGKRMAQTRLEEQQAERELGVGESNCARLEAGRKFKLVDHPVEELNREYLLLRLEHWGEQKQGGQSAGGKAGAAEEPTYRNVFECIPSEVAWRPPRVTPRPRVEGPQTAVVTGPAGEEIHVDEFGRVKVKFPWDLEGPEDDKSSCWVRVSQGWGGAGYGSMFIPRLGMEVVIEFMEGDPDRPIIAGRVYNGENVHPEDLPAKKTVSVIRTATSPGGGGHNEIRLDDAGGSQNFGMHAQKDMNIKVVNNKTEQVGVDETHSIGTNHTIQVGADQTLEVGANRTTTVKADETLEVTGSQTVTVNGRQMTTIGGNRSLHVVGNAAEGIGGLKAVAVKGAYNLDVTGAVSETVGGARLTLVKGDHTGKAGAYALMCGLRSIKAKGACSGSSAVHTDICSGKYIIKAGGSFTLEAGTAVFNAPGGITLDAGGAKITMKSGSIKLEGSSISTKASGALKLKGSSVKEN